MKAEYLEYLIRLSIIWTVLLLFYQWSLAKSDHWNLKRMYLLGAYLMGWLIPLLPAVFTSSAVPQWGMVPFEQTTVFIFTENQAEKLGASFIWSWQTLIMILYLTGTLWQLGRLFFDYSQLVFWKKSGLRSTYKNFPVIRHRQISSPFAALGTIFLPAEPDPDHEKMICLHEAIHLKKRHELERIPLLIGSILLWFHPMQWVFSRWQRELQEFEADEGVVKEFPLREYGKLLIQSSMSYNKYQGPGLFSSPLKKRINMMTKRKNRKPLKKGNYLLILALLGFLLINCSDLVEEVDFTEKTALLSSQVDEAPSLKAVSTRDQEATPHRVLLEHVYKEIRYPAIARSSGGEGSFHASFTIDADGKMQSLAAKAVPKEDVNEDLRIVVVGYESVDGKSAPVQETAQVISVLEREIERTLSTLPDWNPAYHDGKAVPVRMDLFFEFKLE